MVGSSHGNDTFCSSVVIVVGGGGGDGAIPNTRRLLTQPSSIHWLVLSCRSSHMLRWDWMITTARKKPILFNLQFQGITRNVWCIYIIIWLEYQSFSIFISYGCAIQIACSRDSFSIPSHPNNIISIFSLLSIMVVFLLFPLIRATLLPNMLSIVTQRITHHQIVNKEQRTIPNLIIQIASPWIFRQTKWIWTTDWRAEEEDENKKKTLMIWG